jgi:L-threonylcarbamoyladenylate synthase
MTLLVEASRPGAVDQAAHLLAAGGLVAFPTDTIYGLGASAFQPASVERLFAAKDRPLERSIPILIAAAEELERLSSDVSDSIRELGRAFWPGPLTLVVPRRSDLPASLGPTPTVGVRVPDHPVALALLRAAGPLAVTSANRSGAEECTTAVQVEASLAGRVDLILDGGRCPGGLASTVAVVEGTTVRILRQGPIRQEALIAVLARNVS